MNSVRSLFIKKTINLPVTCGFQSTVDFSCFESRATCNGAATPISMPPDGTVSFKTAFRFGWLHETTARFWADLKAFIRACYEPVALTVFTRALTPFVGEPSGAVLCIAWLCAWWHLLVTVRVGYYILVVEYAECFSLADASATGRGTLWVLLKM